MASLGLPGPRRASGASSRRSCRRSNPAAASVEPLFRIYMVVAAVGTVFAAGYLLWMLQKVAFGVPKPEFADAHIHDVRPFEWTAWIPILLLIVVLGVFPNLMFQVTDDAVRVDRDAVRIEDDRSGLAVAQVPGDASARRGEGRRRLTCCSPRPRTSRTRPSTGTRSRPTSSSSATIVVVLVADLLAARPRGVADVAHRRGRRARRADPDRHARARRPRPLDVRRRVRRRQLRARVEGLLPRRDVHHDPAVGRLHRRGRLLQGRVLLPAAHVGASA